MNISNKKLYDFEEIKRQLCHITNEIATKKKEASSKNVNEIMKKDVLLTNKEKQKIIEASFSLANIGDDYSKDSAEQSFGPIELYRNNNRKNNVNHFISV